ncbi:unnamed protein product [Brassica oleracea]
MTTATSLGRDPLFLSSSSSSNSDRAAAIKIRFADIIVKSSSNKSEAMMTIRREKQLLQRRQLEEKAMIEERMKVRQEERLALMKMEEEEEARSNCKFEQDPLSAKKTEKELVKLIGGSRKARDRSLLKKFGLVLKTDHIDDDLLYDLEEVMMMDDLRDDPEEREAFRVVSFFISLMEVTKASFSSQQTNAQKQGSVSNHCNKALRLMFSYS